ncbi:MAG TPA: N-acetylmuramoyl-L-alanine amidase [Polyangia bacterium]|jgi:MYXO-CTERM domain-containing protein
MRRRALVLLAAVLLAPRAAPAQKVFLNASDQSTNPVTCGGVESQWAADNAQRAQVRLEAYGFTVQYSQDFANAPSIANNWGADTFLSIHSNAGGGHGTETLYKSPAGQMLAGHINDALVARLTFADRGLKYRTDLHMLNATSMPAALTETLFHDCTTTHATPIGAMTESCFLTNVDGRARIGEGIAQGFCAHYGVTCVQGPPPPPPAPRLALATNIDDVTGQARDLDGDGVFDLVTGQETLVHFTVTNAADATAHAANVVGNVTIEGAALTVLEWHIYDNYPGNACGGAWCLNSADGNAANPPHTTPGAAFDLAFDGFSEGEAKRVDLRVRAEAAAPPSVRVEARFYVKHVDNFYEKAGWDGAPNNVGDLQTFNGGDLKIRSIADVWPASTPDDGGTPAADDGGPPQSGDGGSGTPDAGSGVRAYGMSSGCTAGGSAGGAAAALLGLALGLARRRRRR